MKTFAVAVEGVLAREPSPTNFAESAPIIDGLSLKNVLESGAWVVLVTGRSDDSAVKHWLQSNGVTGSLEVPTVFGGSMSTVSSRLQVYNRLHRQNRGGLTVVDLSDTIRQEMLKAGVTVIQPWWPRYRANLDDDDFMPLRPTPRFWGG